LRQGEFRRFRRQVCGILPTVERAARTLERDGERLGRRTQTARSKRSETGLDVTAALARAARY
jgi:hypothetical protein